MEVAKLKYLIPWAAATLAAAILAGCAGGLQPVESPLEVTPPPSQAARWQELEALRQDDWFHVLNVGSEAFDWRLPSAGAAVRASTRKSQTLSLRAADRASAASS